MSTRTSSAWPAEPPAAPFSVALTGGIAAGKSEVAARFANRAIEVIDADVIARELVQPGSPALQQIVETFGTDFIGADGQLDRRALRDRVFNDDGERKRLEAILHPRIHSEIQTRATAAASPYVVLAIPLLRESGRYGWVDRVLVVDASAETQLARLMARDGVTAELAESIRAAQASREQRLAIAADVVVNDGSLDDLDDAVERLHRRYLDLAAGKRRTRSSSRLPD